MKAILLCRVSTEEQDLDQQTEKVYQAALNDGYSKNDIITVAAKESGISLREEERQSLNEMKHLIESDPAINCVYIYEPSRLARRADVNTSIKQYLVDRKIQLVCLRPEFRLLDSDGKVNQTANIVFGVFTTISENEMYNAKDRMNRGRQYAISQGRIAQGRVLYGYRLDKTKHIEVDPEAANVIIECYEMMASGNHSYSSIRNEFKERGIFTNKYSKYKIIDIFRCREYYGGKSKRNKYHHQYPAIITEDLFNRAHAQIDINMFKPKRIYKYTFLGRSIFFDLDGYMFMCKKKITDKFTYYQNQPQSSYKICFAAIATDRALWFLAKSRYELIAEINKMVGVEEDSRNKDIMIIKTKLKVSMNNISNIQDKIDRLEERYIEGKISEEKTNSMESNFKKEISIENKNVIKYNEQIRQLESCTKELNEYDDLDSIDNIDLQYDIVKKVIDKVIVEKVKLHVVKWTVEYKPLFSNDKASITQTFLLNAKDRILYTEDNSWRLELK
jgi:site-specific DNA recombinase